MSEEKKPDKKKIVLQVQNGTLAGNSNIKKPAGK
jgi:hypothetical protein